MDRSTGGVRSADADPDLEWCYDVVQGVSRTFAITIDVLEEPMSSYICIGYLLCRIPDTIEDAGHIPAETKVDLLRIYDRVLDAEDPVTPAAFLGAVEPWIPADPDRTADWALVAETPRVFRVYDRQPGPVKAAIRPPARELVSGMATFVDRYAGAGGLRIQTREELRAYCHYAAGTVGELITNLVCTDATDERTRQRLYETAEPFGLSLQLVNIVKDVYADYHHENNVYLPAEDLAAEDVPQESVCAPRHREGVVAVVRSMADYARTFLDDAQRYLELVPEREGNRVAAWAIPYLLAVGTLREISERPGDALTEQGVKVSRAEVRAVIQRTADGVDADELTRLRETISTRALHRD